MTLPGWITRSLSKSCPRSVPASCCGCWKDCTVCWRTAISLPSASAPSRTLKQPWRTATTLTQFMQASAYVRFKPDTEERPPYLYRAYTKWCEDNLESPVPQKKFSQFLLKNAGKYGLTFSKHIFGLLLRVRSGRPLHIYRPTRVQFNRSCAGSGEVQRRHAYDECPKNSAKLTREDLKIAPESPTMERQELAVPCEFSVRNSMVISDETSDQTPAVEPSDQTSKNRSTRPRSFTGWKRSPNCWRSPTVLRTICATPRKTSR